MSRTSRTAGLGVAAVTVVVAGLLSGCGVADDEVRAGGVAAEVDGTELSLSDVDETTTAVCAYLGSGAVDGFTPFPRSLQRSSVVTTLLQQAAFESIVAERDLTLPEGYDAAVASLETEFDDQDPDLQDTLVAFATANTYVSAASSAVGDAAFEAEGTPADSPDVAAQRGLADANAWLQERDVVINPVIELSLTDDGLVQGSDDLSVPASSYAVSGALDLRDPAVGEQIDALVATLPAEQVCGA